SRNGAKRANVIVVTKCPPDLSAAEQQKIIQKLKPKASQKVFFTCIVYDDLVHSEYSEMAIDDATEMQRVLVAGIAKPEYFFKELAGPGTINKRFPDHHDFTETEINELNQLANDKIIITTEKDYMRLKGKLPAERLFYLPIKTQFITGSNDFDNTILNYVGQSTANR
ncbi:MAG: tetraacyldisaccharide 4'-kinase, partial [Bacteroidota bacterium]